MSSPTRRTSGIRGSSRSKGGGVRRWGVAAALVLIGVPGCNYTFQAGSGFPPYVRTLAVVPFDNDTDRFEVSQELHDVLLQQLPRTFGLRTAGEEFADAVVRGTVRSYSVQAGSYRPEANGGDRTQVVQREVRLSVEIQVVDLVNGIVLWENPGLSATGEYLEATETEDDGRELALTRLVQDIINGLQSNW
jgi:Lipopolysaccharide-assembly